MDRRIIDLGSDGASLKKKRGHLLVELDGKSQTIPFDDIEAVIVHAYHAIYTNSLLVELANRGIPLVLADTSHKPVSWFWPISNNFEQSRRMQAQLKASDGLKRRLWAQLIKAKINAQAYMLDGVGHRGNGLRAMAKRVRSGDPDNLEAQAAQRYWLMVFGKNFRRNQSTPGINGMLNYGYTVLRAAVARYTMATGLHPSLGLHHSNRFNDFCLIDDVMEPFRPMVDYMVYQLVEQGIDDVTVEAKSSLVSVLTNQVEMERGFVPLTRAIEWMAMSISTSFIEGKARLSVPQDKAFFERKGC